MNEGVQEKKKERKGESSGAAIEVTGKVKRKKKKEKQEEQEEEIALHVKPKKTPIQAPTPCAMSLVEFLHFHIRSDSLTDPDHGHLSVSLVKSVASPL